WQDLPDSTIPAGAVAGIALVGVTHRLMAAIATGSGVGDALVLVAFDAALAGGCFLLVREIYFRRRGVDGLGFGDVKLAAASAVLVGATGFALALGAASLVGIAVALLRRPSGGSLAGIKIAFGAVLAPAVALVFAASAVGLAPAWTG
ncbi:MAG TPA: hypothetical protein VMP03_05240, partial [Methylomirabilota bacterium]|nr:hypothetical protein [Methylomirabilota bacterium]